jgi:hypothetical protein
MVKRAVLVLVLALNACTLFDDGPPKNTCKSDSDCFRAQGEKCDLSRHVCVVAVGDAGVD